MDADPDLLLIAVFCTADDIAALVARATDAFLHGPWMPRAERTCGAVLVALGVRLALANR